MFNSQHPWGPWILPQFFSFFPPQIHATNTENYIKGKSLLDVNTLKEACTILNSELKPDNDPTEASAEYRVSLAVNLFYKVFTSFLHL